jgi:hypothetical protein
MLIAFCGYKGSGKDTCSDYLVEKYGFKKIAFADQLKNILKTMFMFTDEQLYGTIEQKETPDARWFGCTPRLAMQYVGTELIRNQLGTIMPSLGNDYFVKYLEMQIMAMRAKDPTVNIVISDLRCLNEEKLVRKFSGWISKIERETLEQNDSHLTETEFLKIQSDFPIKNNKNVKSLYRELDALVEKVSLYSQMQKITAKPENDEEDAKAIAENISRLIAMGQITTLC